MKKINEVLNKGNCLSVFFTAGYPEKNNCIKIISTLQNNGVGMIEIGIPFSDPLADGPVIQKSSSQSLQNGTTLDIIFEELLEHKDQIESPILLMGYFNSIFSYGVEKFLQKCNVCNIEAVIIPDMSPEIYENEYLEFFQLYNVNPVFIITPQTVESRILKIDELSNAFIYVLSSSTTTGNIDKYVKQNENWFFKISAMKLKNKTVLGFGIRSADDLRIAFQYFDGAIIGSAFIQAQEQEQEQTFLLKLMENI